MTIATLAPLSDLLQASPAEEPIVSDERPLTALHRSRQVEVTAVLDRTCVIRPDARHPFDKATAKHSDLLVDPATITWKRRPHAEAIEAGDKQHNWRHTSPFADKKHRLASDGTCGCEPLPGAEECERRAPLGLVQGPRGGEHYVPCKRWLAEHPRAARQLARARVEDQDEDLGAEVIAELAHTKADGSGEPHADPGPQVSAGKRCTKCGEVRDPVMFSPGQSWCRPCKRAYDNAKRAEKVGTPEPGKRCTRCGSPGRLDENGECHRHHKSAETRAKLVESGHKRWGTQPPAPATDDTAHAPAAPSSTPVPVPDVIGWLEREKRDRLRCIFCGKPETDNPACCPWHAAVLRHREQTASADVEQALSSSEQADLPSSQPEGRGESQVEPAPSAEVDAVAVFDAVAVDVPSVLDQLAELERALDTAAEAGARITELEQQLAVERQRSAELAVRLEAAEILNSELQMRIGQIVGRLAKR